MSWVNRELPHFKLKPLPLARAHRDKIPEQVHQPDGLLLFSTSTLLYTRPVSFLPVHHGTNLPSVLLGKPLARHAGNKWRGATQKIQVKSK